MTTEVEWPAFVTLPTSPSALTTGVFTWTPELVPTSMTICCENAPDGNESTDVFNARKSCGYCGPDSKRSKRSRSLLFCTADAFSNACAR